MQKESWKLASIWFGLMERKKGVQALFLQILLCVVDRHRKAVADVVFSSGMIGDANKRGFRVCGPKRQTETAICSASPGNNELPPAWA